MDKDSLGALPPFDHLQEQQNPTTIWNKRSSDLTTIRKQFETTWKYIWFQIPDRIQGS